MRTIEINGQRKFIYQFRHCHEHGEDWYTFVTIKKIEELPSDEIIAKILSIDGDIDDDIIEWSPSSITDIDESLNKTCTNCGQIWATHNDDGSCVDDIEAEIEDIRQNITQDVTMHRIRKDQLNQKLNNLKEKIKNAGNKTAQRD
jgi:hypothetical protein